MGIPFSFSELHPPWSVSSLWLWLQLSKFSGAFSYVPVSFLGWKFDSNNNFEYPTFPIHSGWGSLLIPALLKADVWHANEKLQSREATMQDSLRELPNSLQHPWSFVQPQQFDWYTLHPNMSLLLVFLYVVMKTSAEGVQSPSWGRNIRTPGLVKRPLSRTVCWGTFDREWGHLGETLRKQRGREQGREKGVTTPPQHHHHLLPQLCQTPLSVAPTPNFLPLPLKGLLWLLFRQFQCLHLAKHKTLIDKVFFPHCTMQQRSPSVWTPWHHLQGHPINCFLKLFVTSSLENAVRMRLMGCIEYTAKHGPLLWLSTLSMLCYISHWAGLLAHGSPFSFIFAQWAPQYKTGALSSDTVISKLVTAKWTMSISPFKVRTVSKLC